VDCGSTRTRRRRPCPRARLVDALAARRPRRGRTGERDPAEWVAPTEPADSLATGTDHSAAGLALPHVTAGPELPYVSSGRLSLFANGKSFGEETYDLRIAQEGTTLRSSGRFWFKVVLATVQVSFEQTLEADATLRPILYTAAFHAPWA